jgi:mRNA-degrading endonuclease toxin of MazEF toxin-antitoxin module
MDEFAPCGWRTDLMERGDVYLVSLDPAHGREQQGRRPVLVVSPTAFNQLTRLPIIVPITTGGNFARSAGFAVSLTGTGMQTTGVVRCDQPRVLDLAARGGKKIERAPDAILSEVLARISPLFE